jgi:hypothetical protein
MRGCITACASGGTTPKDRAALTQASIVANQFLASASVPRSTRISTQRSKA